MKNDEAINLVKNAFSLIENAKSTNDVLAIIDKLKILTLENVLEKNSVNTATFPQINFQFTEKDIKLLKKYFEEVDFKIKNADSIKDPLSKLLYSLAWKNGDLGKIKHIYKGINAGLNNPSENVNQAIVFHQFGKHLANPDEQPIIDQHVIRAYAFYKNIDKSIDELERFRKIEEITLNHNYFVNGYVKWIKGITDKLENKRDFIYQVDRLLFAVGKTIKLKKIKK